MTCNGPATHVRAFVPFDSRAFGAPAGKHRTFVAWTCASCTDDPAADFAFELMVRPTTGVS